MRQGCCTSCRVCVCSLYGQIMQICLTKCNCFHACIAHRSVAAAARGIASAPDSGCCVSAAALLPLLLSRLRPGLEKSNGNFTIFPCSHTCACLVPGLDQSAPFFWSSPSFLIFHARENERALVVSGPRDWVACQWGGELGVQAVRHLLLSFDLSLYLFLSCFLCLHSHTALTLRFAFEMVMGLHLNCAYVVQGV